MSDATPFAVLETAPTLDVTAVKRAYFAALAKHPPHADPEGFRRLRAAYETLSSASGRAAAYAACPPDYQAELQAWRARFGAAVAEAEEARRAGEDAEAVVRRFVDWLSSTRLADLGGEPPPTSTKGRG